MIDHNQLMKRFSGRKEFIAKLIRSALDHYRDTPGELIRCVEAGDLDGISRIAHGLKSTGGNLMAQRLRDEAQRAQTAGDNKDPAALDAGRELCATLGELLDECRQWLDSTAEENKTS